MSYKQYLPHQQSTIIAYYMYNLRDRLNNDQLPDRMSHLTNYCNFTVQMLFCDSYCLYWLYCIRYLLSCILSFSVQLRSI